MAEVRMELANVCGGELEEKFQELVPALIASLGDEQKGAIAIKIEFKRLPNTSSMVGTSFTITPRFPASKKASICQINGEDYSLKTEEPIQKPKLVNMFEKVEGGKM